jgi:tetratricopeptide (TPR) repeat protein
VGGKGGLVHERTKVTALLQASHHAINAGDIGLAQALLARAEQEGADPGLLLSVRAALSMKTLDFTMALDLLEQAEALRPFDYLIPYNQGICLYELGRYPEAVAAHRRSLTINMNQPKAWMKLGGAYLVQQCWAEALACQERAVGLDSTDGELHCALGTTISILGDNAGAEAAYRRSMELSPGHHEPEIALGFVLLRAGKWEEGWRHFEARWKLRPFGAPWDYKPTQPWQGYAAGLVGKKVVLRSEQGYGDTIHFIRYLPLVMERATEVTVVVPPPLIRLIESMGTGAGLTNDQTYTDLDAIDLPLMSLPRVFGTTPENVPPPAHFNVTPRKIEGARIGLCWQGGSRPHDPIAHADDLRRSVPPDVFAPIVEACAGQAISLQWEDVAAWGCEDWQDTAEIVAGLDLVVTVDTAIAHLAGSLGVKCWMLARAGGCWRWLSQGTTTVWYPATIIFRQQVLGDWRPTVAGVADLVKEWRKR